MARDDDDDDDRPRKRRRDRDDDDDDDDDRPRRRKRSSGSGDAGVGYVIPYKNAPALISYYIGFGGLLLCFCGGLSFISGLAAIVLGIMGMIRASKNKEAHGRVHALVGIILGAAQVLLGTPTGILILVAILKGR
jgi:hypothetical protein